MDLGPAGTTATRPGQDGPATTTPARVRTNRLDLALAEARYAYRHASAYRGLLDRAGVDVDGLADLADFRSLPLTDKQFYRANYPAGVVALAGPLSAEQHVLISHSSGTGGQRLTTAAHTYDLARRMADTTSVHLELKRRLLRARSQRIARYAAPNCSDVECASPLTTMESRTLRDGTLVLPVGHDLLATRPSMVEQAIEEVGIHRPDWFYTDATHLAFLLRQYRARALPPPAVSAVILTYTLATHVARRQVVAALAPAIPVAEVVSMSELGWVAMECPRGVLHLNTATFFMELLDATAAEVPEGGVGELVATSLRDRLLPHVRYRTGDLYRRLPPCPCGSPFPAVRHEGRAVHHLALPDGRGLSPKEFDDLVGADPGVVLYRMQQRSPRRFRFSYVPAEGTDGTATGAALRERIVAALGPDAQVEVEQVEYIATDRTGKFLSCLGAGIGGGPR
ncbi:phenylacetate--CoA ligase family protein [Micromonospora sp. NPDC007271]|uniref:phenylacetate--CoA ligase family protein n=1 Tax=Micromonospora sp. NPDC007271 TaxID=3154587 RepID=UPI0033F7BF8B